MYFGFTIPIYCYNRARSINTLLECLDKNSYLRHDVILVLDHPKTPPRVGELLPDNPYPTVWELLDRKWRTRQTNGVDIRVSFKLHTKDPENAQWHSAAETVNFAAAGALSNRVMILSNPDFYLSPNWDYNIVKYGLGRRDIAWGVDLYYDYEYHAQADIQTFARQKYMIKPVHHYCYPFKHHAGKVELDWSRRGWPGYSLKETEFLNYASEISATQNTASLVDKYSAPYYTLVFDTQFFISGGGMPLDCETADLWDPVTSTIKTHFFKFVPHDSVALTYHCDMDLEQELTAGPGTGWFVPHDKTGHSVTLQFMADKVYMYESETRELFAKAVGQTIYVINKPLFSALRNSSLSQLAAILASFSEAHTVSFRIIRDGEIDTTITREITNDIAYLNQEVRPPSRKAWCPFKTASDLDVTYTAPVAIRDMVYIENSTV